jgi:hypothetical protein
MRHNDAAPARGFCCVSQSCALWPSAKADVNNLASAAALLVFVAAAGRVRT